MGLKPDPWDYYFLQCFDTVGWVIRPIKPVPDMTCNVFSGTLNPTQASSHPVKKNLTSQSQIFAFPAYLGATLKKCRDKNERVKERQKDESVWL